MKRYETVKSKRDFDYIIKNGKKYQNKHISVFELKNKEEIALFGIAVSKKLGNAVFRNKKRRQIRCILDKYKYEFKNKHSYIIILKEAGSKISYKILEESIKNLLKEV